MTRSILQRAAVATLLAGAIAAPVFAAEPTANAAYDTYRHVVLGQTQAPVAQQARFDEFGPRQLTAGYARYLLNNGQSAWSVQQVAAGQGDVVVTRTPSTDERQLSAYQLYQRYLGQTVPALGDPVSASNVGVPAAR